MKDINRWPIWQPNLNSRTATPRDTFSYTPFGKVWSSNSMVEGKPRLSFIGKEIDRESGLGDYGARKYEPSYGRFTSVDPHWEKYRPLSPYNYSNNNPITAIDADGRNIVLLVDSDGAYGLGHEAVLIGNDEDGWLFFSKNGFGKDNQKGVKFDNLEQFAEAVQGKGSKAQYAAELQKYDGAYEIQSSKEEDKAAIAAASSEEQESYMPMLSDCLSLAAAAVGAVKPEEKPKAGDKFDHDAWKSAKIQVQQSPTMIPNAYFHGVRNLYKGNDITRQLLQKQPIPTWQDQQRKSWEQRNMGRP